MKQNIDSYSYSKERADRFVVTSLQLHVTLVSELLDITSSPQDSVTPRRDTALPAAGNGLNFRAKVKREMNMQ